MNVSPPVNDVWLSGRFDVISLHPPPTDSAIGRASISPMMTRNALAASVGATDIRPPTQARKMMMTAPMIVPISGETPVEMLRMKPSPWNWPETMPTNARMMISAASTLAHLPYFTSSISATVYLPSCLIVEEIRYIVPVPIRDGSVDISAGHMPNE